MCSSLCYEDPATCGEGGFQPMVSRYILKFRLGITSERKNEH